MSAKPYALVTAENALNEMIDKAKTPGGDLWALEQQKRAFLTSLHEAIVQEVATQTQKITEEIKASQEMLHGSVPFQNSALSYERIERYNTRSHSEPSFENFLKTIASIPKTLAFSAVVVLAFYGFINLFVRF